MNKKTIKIITLIAIFILIILKMNLSMAVSKEELEKYIKENGEMLIEIDENGYGATKDIENERAIIQLGINIFSRIIPDKNWDEASIDRALKYGYIIERRALLYGTEGEMFGGAEVGGGAQTKNGTYFENTMTKLEKLKNGEEDSTVPNDIPWDWQYGGWPNCSPNEVEKFEYIHGDEDSIAVFEYVCKLYALPNPSSENMSKAFAEKYIIDLWNIMNQSGMNKYLQNDGREYKKPLLDMIKTVYDDHKNIIDSEDAINAYKEAVKNGANISVTGGNKDKEAEEEKKKKESIYTYPGQSGSSSSSGTLDDMIGDADKFVDSAGDAAISSSSLQDFSNKFYNIFLAVGTIMTVLVGLILGIKFMLGGAEEKAHIKELLIPYIVGCVVIFGAFAIWKIIVTILSESLI